MAAGIPSYIDWMGTVFARDSLNARQTYVLGFTTKRGTRGKAFDKNPTRIAPNKNSLNGWVTDTLSYGFLDFRPFSNRWPKYKKMFRMGAMHQDYRKGMWPKIFDGVFYIRDMKPVKKISISDSK